MSWRDRNPAARTARFEEAGPRTNGTDGTIAPDPAPIVPIVPIVLGLGTADALAERAAIVQEGAGVPADWADGFALLEAQPVPPGVPAKDWLAMMNAAGRFLDQWGGKAAALGWTAGELFGLDEGAPLARLDRRGAAFFLSRAEILAVTREAITVRVGGAVQSIYRRGELDAPAWQATETKLGDR